jgi:hypothetical protein
MAYSKYAIQRRCWMTLHTVVWLMLVGAAVVTAAATRFDVSPWRILASAGIATAVTIGLAMYVAGEQCGVSTTTGDRLFEIMIASTLTLYGATALGGVVDGIRLGRAGDRDAAITRCVGCPVAGAVGVGVVFFTFLLAIAHCLD